MGIEIQEDKRRQAATVLTATHHGGVFYTSPIALAASALTVAQNTLYGTPIFVPRRQQYSTIAFNRSNATDVSWRVGLYSDDGDGYPGALVVDAGATANDVAVAGDRFKNISNILNPGWYWMAIVCVNGAGTLAVSSVGSDSNIIPMLGLSTNVSTSDIYGISVAFAYAALPNPFTAGAVVIVNAPALMLGI